MHIVAMLPKAWIRAANTKIVDKIDIVQRRAQRFEKPGSFLLELELKLN